MTRSQTSSSQSRSHSLEGKGQSREFHLVVRYATLGGVPDPIALHREVLRRRGAVCFAKVGKRVGAECVNRMREVIDSGGGVSIYLTRRVDGKYRVARGNVIRLGYIVPANVRQFMPEYYHYPQIAQFISTWFLMDHLSVEQSATAFDLVVKSSQAPLTEALQTSTAGHFFAEPTRTSKERNSK